MESGVDLFHIFEYEWKTKNPQIKNYLKNLFSKDFKQGYKIKKSSKEEYLIYKNFYSIGTKSIGKEIFGLYDNDEPVYYVSFSKTPKIEAGYEIKEELFIRNILDSERERLLKFFMEEYKTDLIYYLDRMKYSYKNYPSFDLLKIIPPKKIKIGSYLIYDSGRDVLYKS